MKKTTIRYCVKQKNYGRKRGYFPVMSPYAKINKAKFLRACVVPESSSMDNTGEMACIMFNVGEQLLRLLEEGNTVEVPNFGTFRLAVHARASNTPEEATADKIQRVSIRFLPCAEMRKRIHLTNFEFLPASADEESKVGR